VENIANIFCIGLVMFYLLLLIVLVAAPLFKQRNLASDPESEKGGHGGPSPDRCQTNEDE